MLGFEGTFGDHSSTCLPKQVHVKQVAQDHIRCSLHIFREGASTASLGSLFQCSCHPHRKEVFLHVSLFLLLSTTWLYPPDTCPSDIHCISDEVPFQPPLVGAGQWGLCLGAVHEPQQTFVPTVGIPSAHWAFERNCDLLPCSAAS